MKYRFSFYNNGHYWVTRKALSRNSAMEKFKLLCNGKYKSISIDLIERKCFGKWKPID